MAPKPPTPAIPTPRAPELPALNIPPLPRDSQSTLTRPHEPGTTSQTLPAGTLHPVDRGAGVPPPTPIAGPSTHVRDSSANPSSDLSDVDPWKHYRLPSQARSALPAPDAEGLRIARLHYVDLDNGITVRVGWDENTQAYRAKRRDDLTPSGPILYLNDDRKTWRTRQSQSSTSAAGSTSPPVEKRPRLDQAQHSQPDAAPTYINTDHYVWNENANNHHGYVVMHRKRGLDDTVGPPSCMAFRDDNGLFVGVEPATIRINQPARLLPAWTDRDLWDFYGIHGNDIERFRTEAATTGKKPRWAKPRAQRLENVYLYDELRRWLGPNEPRETYVKTLEGYTPQRLATMLDKVNLYWKTNRPPIDANSAQGSGVPTPVPRPVVTQPAGANPSAPVFGDHAHYTWDINNKTRQGYVVMHRNQGLDDSYGPVTQLAFHDDKRLINVQAPGYNIDRHSPLRPFWSDYVIWNLYRIEGRDIERFRQEVALTGMPPQWVKPREYPSLREQLIDHLRLWTSSPHRPVELQADFIAKLRPYNLSTRQLSQLCTELTATGQFPNRLNNDLPMWVEAHRQTTLNETDIQRFEPFIAEFQTEILSLRNQGHAPSSLKDHLTPTFFNSLLSHVGYRRNRHNCLARSDIPAMFRADDRTPFEFARDNVMLSRGALGEGTTEQIAVSATFSLKDAVNYAREVDPEALAYDSQFDTHAGKQADDVDDVDDDPLAIFQPVLGEYISKRRSQGFSFYYLFDTRYIEVVPARENYAFNKDALDKPLPGSKTWFPDDDLEGHISVSSRGFSADRIWLVNSNLTRAAKVTDIHTQSIEDSGDGTDSHADAIEERTWAGQLNRDEYDALIDQVANSGKPVLDFPANQDVFSNDIVFTTGSVSPNAV
ncbi:hypothetical protein PMI21_02330 [Pseudomonas sp. GM18]|uniref:hypothetical protein n=1 Tax=Pseudomonas sp. GM18 TaxID=1144324 RepID=UPI000272710C|nr:hypothetical protein [Pseudomonas sp. GM18]EJM18172.1 hypothetical protein PMI21_02330 [Pseudomonas sp. GM18]